MKAGEKKWTAIVHIRGRDSFGQFHDDDSIAIAEIADYFGGGVSLVGDAYVGRLYVEAVTKADAQAQVERDLFEILKPHTSVRATVIDIKDGFTEDINDGFTEDIEDGFTEVDPVPGPDDTHASPSSQEEIGIVSRVTSHDVRVALSRALELLEQRWHFDPRSTDVVREPSPHTKPLTLELALLQAADDAASGGKDFMEIYDKAAFQVFNAIVEVHGAGRLSSAVATYSDHHTENEAIEVLRYALSHPI